MDEIKIVVIKGLRRIQIELQKRMRIKIYDVEYGQ